MPAKKPATSTPNANPRDAVRVNAHRLYVNAYNDAKTKRDAKLLQIRNNTMLSVSGRERDIVKVQSVFDTAVAAAAKVYTLQTDEAPPGLS